MAGEVALPRPAPVKIGKDDQLAPRARTATARGSMVFHSLRWMGRLVADYENTGERALPRPGHRDRQGLGGRTTRAAAPAPARTPGRSTRRAARPRAGLPQQARQGRLADSSLAEHAKILSDPTLYKKGHNHGLDQDIALLGIGCRYGRDGLAAWRSGG